jgi:hypothetical protein
VLLKYEKLRITIDNFGSFHLRTMFIEKKHFFEFLKIIFENQITL